MSAAAHGICPNYNRCNKYLEFTLKLGANEERDRKKNAVIAAQARRIAELETMLGGGDSGTEGGKEDAMPKKPFGSSTPSSKIPIKPNSEEESRRRLRPLVIARKLSFGSQSTDGLRIRETLLTVMDTLRLRWDDPVGKLMEAFEAIAANPEADVTDILFPKKPAAGVGCLAERESAGVSRVRPIRTSTAV